MASRAIRGVTCLIREREDVPQSPINAKQVDSYVFQFPEALSYLEKRVDRLYRIDLGDQYEKFLPL